MASNAQQQIVDVTQLAVLALARPALLGETRLILIDGPAGSGKSTLAGLLAIETNADAIHMDDLYSGWETALSVDTIQKIETEIINPLVAGEPAKFWKFDWHKYAYTNQVELNPTMLILEGVGAAAQPLRKYASLILWIEVAPELGLNRVLSRDGEQIKAEMINWQQKEVNWHREDETRDSAEIILSGVGSEELTQTQYFAVIK